MANKLTLTFTKGESLFITESLERLRSEMTNFSDDEDNDYDAQIRILDKIILKFTTASMQHNYN